MIKAKKEYVPCNLSVYEYLKSKTQSMHALSAITFYGRSITYEKLFTEIDRTERALRAFGVRRGDVVASSLPGIPEGIYLIYAINKIGAIYCAFDCRCKQIEFEEMIVKFNPKLCFVPDFQLHACKNIKDCPIICINPANSIGKMTLFTELIADFFTGRSFLKYNHDNFYSYHNFIYKEREAKNCYPEKDIHNTFGYFYTSGTTQGRKSIILTNENINAAVKQISEHEDYVKRGESMLNIMPLFTCYGWSIGTHLPLTLGVHISLIPIIKPKKLKKYLLREKPNFIITVPSHWEYFVKENFYKCDLSFLRTIIVGGDKISQKYEERINSILKECKSSAFLRISYGMSETTSVGTTPDINTPKGSVGKPMAYTSIEIFDKDTLEPLPHGEKGEICIMGPTVCRGYYDDSTMTKALLKKHPNGEVWLHSGDIGYIGKDENLYFCERIKRMYVRFDGTKVSPYSIESIILQHPNVENCLVIPIKDMEHSHGMCAEALIIIKPGVSEKIAKIHIQRYIQENLGQHMMPKSIKYVKTLPYTKNGKLDCFSTQKNNK